MLCASSKNRHLHEQASISDTQNQQKINRSTARKRKRSADEIAMKFIKQKFEAGGSSSQRSAKPILDKEVTERISPSAESILDKEVTERISPSSSDHPGQCYRNGTTPTYDIGTPLHTNKDIESRPLISQSTLLSKRCMGKKRFFWTSESDRYSLTEHPFSYGLMLI